MTDSLEITDLLKINDWKAVSDQIREELYEPNFPVRAEQMAWRQILDLLEKTDNLQPQDHGNQPANFMLIAGNGLHDSTRREVVGLLLITYYPKSKCGLAAYMAVAETGRGRGVSHQLMEQGKKLLKNYSKNRNHEPLALFGEVREPHSDQAEDQFDPHARMAIWARHKARIVPIDYVMAPLGEGMPKVYNLNLMAFPIADGDEPKVTNTLVYNFLEEVYISAGCNEPENDSDFPNMTKPLKPLEEERNLPLIGLRWEETGLPCNKYGIAIHFPCKMKQDCGTPKQSDPMFHDIEQDLLAFTWQESPPFQNEMIEIQEKFRRLELVIPSSLTVAREGDTTRIFCNRAIGTNPSPRRRAVRLYVSRTVFLDGICVLHFVLGPDKGRGSHVLSEGDISKLAHGWRASNDTIVKPDHVVTFSPDEVDNLSLSLKELVEQIVVESFTDIDFSSTHCRYGTIQIVGDAPRQKWTVRELSTEMKKFRESEMDDADEEVPEKPSLFLMAIDALLVGDIDYTNLDWNEFQDVYKGLECERRRVRGVHKGTLLEIIEKSRALDMVSATFGISPYVLLPQAVAIYNDYLQQEAERAAHQSATAKDKQCQAFEAQMRSALQSRTLPDVFHYADEQWYFSQMMKSRGLNQRRDLLKRKLAEIENRYNDHLSKRGKRFGVVIAVIGTFLAVIQAAGIIDSLWPGTLEGLGANLKSIFIDTSH